MPRCMCRDVSRDVEARCGCGESLTPTRASPVYPASGLPKWGSFNLAAIFRNCSYLDAVESVTEKPHKLTWPEVPPEGPMSSSGDMCEMCCPFMPAFRPAITKQEA